jgi:hypothetical protein
MAEGENNLRILGRISDLEARLRDAEAKIRELERRSPPQAPVPPYPLGSSVHKPPLSAS